MMYSGDKKLESHWTLDIGEDEINKRLQKFETSNVVKFNETLKNKEHTSQNTDKKE